MTETVTPIPCRPESVEEATTRIDAIDRRLAAFDCRLFPFQRAGALRLATSGSCALLDDPGLGKTAQAVVAFHPGAPVLVCCPSVAKHTWARWIRMARPEHRVTVITKRSDFRFPRPGEAVIINYELLPTSLRELQKLEQEIADAGGPKQAPMLEARLRREKYIRARLTQPYEGTVMIPDEAHRLKNPAALATIRWRELAFLAHTRGGRIWPVTGTPALNTDAELYHVLQAAGLGKPTFGSEQQFLLELAKPDDPVLGAPPGFVAKLRSCSIKRLRTEVLPELPPTRDETILVPLTADVKKLSEDFIAALKVAGVDLETATLKTINTVAMTKIPRELFSALRRATAEAKIPHVVEYVEECDAEKDPLVVFCDHRGLIDVLAARDRWGRISGAENDTGKMETADAFQRGELRGVACTHRGAGVSVTLTRAWHMVLADWPYNQGTLQQSKDRIQRIGQKAAGLLYTRFVVDHPLERRMTTLVESKAAMMERHAAAAVPGRNG